MANYELRRNDPSLDENHETVRDVFADFFLKECPTSLVRSAEPLGFDSTLWSKLLEMGVAAMSLPAAQGGDDATLVDLVLIADEWGRRLAPIPFASHVTATRLLAHTGAPADVVASAAAGERVFTLALQPSTAGVRQLVAEAAISADVIALVGDELSLYASPAPGELVRNQGNTPLAWWSTDGAAKTVLATGQAALDAYELATSEWKLLTAAALTGLGQTALELGVEFTKTRETLGIPIGALQGIAYPLVEAQIEITSSRNLNYKAAWIMENEPGTRPDLPLKAFHQARKTAFQAANTGQHVQGGLGFTSEADVSLYYLRAKGWSAIAGDDASDLKKIGAQLVASASSLLTI